MFNIVDFIYFLRSKALVTVPWQIREDKLWMADVVSVGEIEQDLFAAVENLAIVFEEAEKNGMQVYAVPS